MTSSEVVVGIPYYASTAIDGLLGCCFKRRLSRTGSQARGSAASRATSELPLLDPQGARELVIGSASTTELPHASCTLSLRRGTLARPFEGFVVCRRK